MLHIVVTVPSDEAELAADRLWAAGAKAVEERSGRPSTELIAVLAADAARSIDRLGELPPGWSVAGVEVDDAPDESWRAFAEPIEINDALIVRPAWSPPVGRAGVTEIAIEPGGSFGLGDHPTTRLSGDAAWRLTRPGARVLDVGCGSGVLGIIAARRAAAAVLAIDIAEAAVEATAANAARNHVGDRCRARATPLAEVEGEFDLVLANILAPTLVVLADDLRRVTAADGRLVVAGILVGRWGHVAEALRPMEIGATSQMGDWACVVFEHPPTVR